MTDEDWNSEVALVAGGNGDIGGAVVDRLLSLGARVASADLRPGHRPPGERYWEELRNLAEPGEAAAWVAAVEQEWGTPTVVVVAVGASGNGRLTEVGFDQWRSVLAACLDAAYLTAVAALPRMVANGVPGRIVFLGSWAAHAPHPHIGAYSVAKAGLRALMQTLALDHAADGILVNEVAPGVVDAGLSRVLLAEDEALRQRTLGGIPLGRMLTSEDVARDVLHLASPLNRTTTGAVLVSDGGLSLASTMNPGRPR